MLDRKKRPLTIYVNFIVPTSFICEVNVCHLVKFSKKKNVICDQNL